LKVTNDDVREYEYLGGKGGWGQWTNNNPTVPERALVL